ncbi:large-conductance mechanosensitive channel protein MscL [Acetivibrio mesophilus]|uniref:Large-conductance mechanosensitive channel n=1 Tax=Acetivibrio mesophilus TaxID=2487273 RepID=A0A4Q0I5H3_9FIRM|nr:large-conductance mechanosensitive channel protein MscL [Acetivibrio mesophilus]ODM26130.1 mechanosensitive ion channel protein MscL [Clostridium sp. Bc-iso-3]RXE59097.1 large-conductance mechanosensitive channel protein MscL [Acetivibrio mesophilus]HHV29503.1 large-conductance mechanosensitive channel protein MscL [Clostridium sp.]
MLKDFKKFALKGNVIDLAIGVIIGGAFGKIVSSLVDDIIMPLLGIILGRIDLTSLKLVIKPAAEDVAELSLKYGQFLQSVIDFLIIAFSIFFMMKLLFAFKKKEEEKPKAPEPSKEELLLTEIRDLLKERK